MTPRPTDRKTADAASDLIALHGSAAAQEAACRADQSRDKGNAIKFCHWRQVERFVILLSTDRVQGTIH
jgi:hypothetical protein